MRRIILFAFLIIASVQSASSQNAIAQLKYEDAEEAYSLGNYELTISKLKEVETMLGATNPKILYLQILAQSKVIEKNPMRDYFILENARKSSEKYLKEYENLPDNADRYRDIYKIAESLKAYPASREAYDAELNKVKKIEQEQKAAADARQIEDAKRAEAEKQRLAAEAEKERIKKMRNIGFFAFRAGVALPSNEVSKSLITYEEWFTNTVFAVPFENGKFGLKTGFRFGFTGIAPLAYIGNRVGFGLAMDLNQTFMTYNWKDLGETSGDNAHFFTDAKYQMFSISSLGAGPSFTVRPANIKMYIDLYFRAEANFITGGKYEIDYYNETYDHIVITSARSNSVQVRVGTTAGLNFRLGHLFLGVDFRMGLTDNSPFSEHFIITDINGNSGEDDTPYRTPGLILNYTGISLGVNF